MIDGLTSPSVFFNRISSSDLKRRRLQTYQDQYSSSAGRDVSESVSALLSVYPWLQPGTALSLGQAHQSPDSPLAKEVSTREANNRVKKSGWPSFGDILSPSKWLREINDATNAIGNQLQTVARWGTTALQATSDEIGASARAVATGKPFSRGVVSSLINQPSPEEADPSTLAIALGRKISGEDAGLGSGYFAQEHTKEGESGETAREEQTRRAQAVYSVNGHAGTPGRILAQVVAEPGSTPYNIVSGLIDATASWKLDPFSAAASAGSQARKAAKIFNPDDLATPSPLGRVARDTEPDAFDDIDAWKDWHAGTISTGIRKTVDKTRVANFLTLDEAGKKTVDKLTENQSAYDIWQRMGGDQGKITPELARRLASTRNTDETLGVLDEALELGNLREKPVTSLLGVQSPLGGYKAEIRSRLDGVRAFNTVPSAMYDLADSNATAQTMVNVLKAGRAPKSLIEESFAKISEASEMADRAAAVLDAEFKLAEYVVGSTPQTKRYLNRVRGAFVNNQDALDMLTREQVASQSPITGVIIDGAERTLRSPGEDAELISRTLPAADGRMLRRLMVDNQSWLKYGPVINNKPVEMTNMGLNWLLSKWKTSVLMRPAFTLRVIGSEQAALGAAGYTSLFNHPIRHIAYAISTDRKYSQGGLDVFGNPTLAAKHFSQFRSSMQSRGGFRESVMDGHRTSKTFLDSDFANTFADDLLELNQNEIARRLAGGWDEADQVTRTGNDVNDVKAWFASDDAAEFRAQYGVDVTQTDAFVDNTVLWVKDRTNLNKDLVDAIRTGQLGKTPLYTLDGGFPVPHPELPGKLQKDFIDRDIGPSNGVGDIVTSPRPGGHLDKATDWLFSTLLERPREFWSVNPSLSQEYWKRVGELLPQATREAQDEILELAGSTFKKGKLSREDPIDPLRRIAARGDGPLDMNAIDMLSRDHSANTVKNLLYDFTRRNQFFDATRLIFPFGDAWKEELVRWSRIIQERPQTIPKANLVLKGAQDSGFFHTDEESGEEVFTYPFSGFIMGKLTGVPVPMQARATSLSMFSDHPLMPGFGPVAQIAVSKLTPDKPEYDWIRNVINPYGQSSELSSFLPSWAQKIKTGFSDPSSDRVFANAVWDVSRYLASTGEYDLSTPEGQEKLEDDARKRAKLIYVFRGIAQAGLPASPQPKDIAEDINGQTVTAYTLTKRYRELLDEDKEDNTVLATSRFIDEFGEKNLLFMQSATKGGKVFSKSGYDWVRDNMAIVDRYPEIYSYFAPNDGGFDQKAYAALFTRGERRILSPREAIEAANHRVANMIYRAQKDKLPAKITDEHRARLKLIQEQLVKQYPGYDPMSGIKNNEVPDHIAKLTDAIDDPLVADLPITQAIREYLDLRNKAQAAATTKLKLASYKSAKSALSIRNVLREQANRLSERYPGFGDIWDQVFSRELKDDRAEP